MSLWLIPLFFAIYFIIVLVLTRMRAEQGFPVHAMENMPNHHILIDSFGTRMLGTNNLVTLSLFRWFNRSYTSNPMPHQLEGFKLSERTAIAPRRLFFSLLGVSAFASIMVFSVILYLYYKQGALNMSGSSSWKHRIWGTRLQWTPTLALLSNRTEFLCDRWYCCRSSLLNTIDVYACTILLVALPSDRFCCIKRLGDAIFMELYVSKFSCEIRSSENRWTAGNSAARHVRRWIDVR